jgi:uncharacterized protein YndB with AHSA1/START domain
VARTRGHGPGGTETLTKGQVLAIEPSHRLELSWADVDWPVETRVSILLESRDPTTRITLRHGGWSAFPGDQGLGLCKAHEAGWKSHLEAIKDYVETVGRHRSRSRA